MMALVTGRSIRHVVSSFREAGRAAHKPDTADPLWRRIAARWGARPHLRWPPPAPLLGRGGAGVT
jgi:hypothetical protein